MKPEKNIERWRTGSREGVSFKELIKVAEAYGFKVQKKRSTHGYKFKHKDLMGHPRFSSGWILISQHAHGNQGQVHSNAVNDLIDGIDWILGSKND